LIGDGHDNVLNGGPGNDVLIGGLGADTLIGGGGVDTASYQSDTAGVHIDLNSSSAQSGGEAEGDILSGITNLVGGAGNDVLIGDANNNRIDGGAGDDTIEGGLGNDILIGGTNGPVGDTLSYADDTGGVTVNLSTTKAQNTGSEGVDTASGFENLLGGSGNDTLTGNSLANVIDGGSGNDTLTGGGGNDTLRGGDGDDTIVLSGTGDQNDIIDGGNGTDTIKTAGALTLHGFDAGADSIEAWLGTAANGAGITGTAANETFDLGHLASVTGLLFVDGGSGNDTIIGSDAWNGDLRGNAGDDTLIGGAGNDTLTGGTGNDTLRGGDGDDTIVLSGTGDQNDIVDGGNGTDTIKTAGALTLHGFDADADSIEAWLGTAANGAGVTGTAASETFDLSHLASVIKLLFVDGGAGDDIVIGSNAWNGDLRGGAGNDTLHGGTGDDKLTGGTGIDMFVFNAGDGHDTIADFTTNKTNPTLDDQINLSGFGTDYMTNVHDRMTQVGKNVVIDFHGDGSDTLTIANTTISFLDAHKADFHLV
jgi:Ca2+-binding RTX toxin-like protein